MTAGGLARFARGAAGVLVVGLVCLLLLETAARIQFARKTGLRTLLYGTPWHRNERVWAAPNDSKLHQGRAAEAHTVNAPRGEQGPGYTKFFPGEARRTYDVDTGESFPVRINRAGFRGEDFAARKAPGVTRVATLGSSSTFGYYDRDDETYPSLLERELERRCPEGAFEVLNLGVPHLTSDEIAALFREEVLDLDPDVVTLYAGNNDSLKLPARDERGALRRAVLEPLSALGDRLLSVRFALYLAASQGGLSGDAGWIESLAEERSAFFMRHIRAMAELSGDHGITFIAANQQRKAASWWPSSAEYRAEMRSIRYADEVRALRKRLSETGYLDNFEVAMLVHDRLMRDLRSWAEAEPVPFVDLIAALDGHRDLLLSNVHLHADANRMIAERLGEAILERVGCPPEPAPGAP